MLGVVAVLTFASGGRSQEGEDAVSRLLYADAQKFLAATEPEVRGEAALTLAAAGEPRHYDAVLQVARADEPAARLRGIAVPRLLLTPAMKAECRTAICL